MDEPNFHVYDVRPFYLILLL